MTGFVLCIRTTPGCCRRPRELGLAGTTGQSWTTPARQHLHLLSKADGDMPEHSQHMVPHPSRRTVVLNRQSEAALTS